MTRFSRRIKRLSRRLGAKRVDDPEGVIAVLQIARRLVKDTDLNPAEALLKAADEMASPKDPVIAFFAAHHAYLSAIPADVSDDLSTEELLEIFDAAISNQGLMNQAVRKGPR